jgi:hypothetical protein
VQKLFQKCVMHTELDIYKFINYILNFHFRNATKNEIRKSTHVVAMFANRSRRNEQYS